MKGDLISQFRLEVEIAAKITFNEEASARSLELLEIAAKITLNEEAAPWSLDRLEIAAKISLKLHPTVLKMKERHILDNIAVDTLCLKKMIGWSCWNVFDHRAALGLNNNNARELSLKIAAKLLHILLS